jgi:hypothetical protein
MKKATKPLAHRNAPTIRAKGSTGGTNAANCKDSSNDGHLPPFLLVPINERVSHSQDTPAIAKTTLPSLAFACR